MNLEQIKNELIIEYKNRIIDIEKLDISYKKLSIFNSFLFKKKLPSYIVAQIDDALMHLYIRNKIEKLEKQNIKDIYIENLAFFKRINQIIEENKYRNNYINEFN